MVTAANWRWVSKADGESWTGSWTQSAKSWNTECSNGQNPFYSVPVVVVEDLMKFCSDMESRQKFCRVIAPRSDQIIKIMRLRAVTGDINSENVESHLSELPQHDINRLNSSTSSGTGASVSAR